MAATALVQADMDVILKAEAEQILAAEGLRATSAVVDGDPAAVPAELRSLMKSSS